MVPADAGVVPRVCSPVTGSLRWSPPTRGLPGPVSLVGMNKSVLTRYRALAYVTGVLLILLTIGVIARYLLHVAGAAGFVGIVGFAHGWLYIAYLVFAFDMGSKAKMPFARLLWVLLAGTVPTAVFFVERKITRELEPLVRAAVPEPAEV